MIARTSTLSGIPSASLSSRPGFYTMYMRLLSLHAASRRAGAADHARSPNRSSNQHVPRATSLRRPRHDTAKLFMYDYDRPEAPLSPHSTVPLSVSSRPRRSFAILLASFALRLLAVRRLYCRQTDAQSRIDRPIVRAPGVMLFSPSALSRIRCLSTPIPYAPKTRLKADLLQNANAKCFQ